MRSRRTTQPRSGASCAAAGGSWPRTSCQAAGSPRSCRIRRAGARLPLGVTRVLAPVRETSGVRTVAPGVTGRFRSAGPAVPAVGDATSALVAVRRVGAGRAVLLADASPLLNGRLDRRDDAALALSVAGEGRPVAFVESVHGYGRASGWGALPGTLPRRPRAARAGRRRARAGARAGASGRRSRQGGHSRRRAPSMPRGWRGRCWGPAIPPKRSRRWSGRRAACCS